MATIAWRESLWAVPMDVLQMESPVELIRLILFADRDLNINKESLKAFALNVAIVIDCLWFLRNKIIHDGVEIDLGKLLATIK